MTKSTEMNSIMIWPREVCEVIISVGELNIGAQVSTNEVVCMHEFIKKLQLLLVRAKSRLRSPHCYVNENKCWTEIKPSSSKLLQDMNHWCHDQLASIR